MENKKEFIIKTFNNSFNLQNFIDFTQELFNGNVRYRSSIELSDRVRGEFRAVVKEFSELGWYKDSNRKSMVIAVVRLEKENSIARSRAIQRNFVKDYFLKNKNDSAFVAFYNNDSSDWRLSFIKLDSSLNESNILEEEITPAKRFSFLLGKNEKHHTAISRFLPLINNDKEAPSVQQIEEVFNIEVVTKEFFEKYCGLYLEIVRCIDSQAEFNKISEKLDFRSDEFAKKLMGQLVFLYFLQKKGWLGVEINPKEIREDEANKFLENKSYGSSETFEKAYILSQGKYIRNDSKVCELCEEELSSLNRIFLNTKYDGNWGTGNRNFIRSLYNRAISEGKNFYKDYLEHLFYNALNDKRGGSTYFKELNCKIPFLNGGLFQPINENYDYENSEFRIPNKIFSNKEKTKQGDIGNGVLDIFDRYAFTIKEDEPLEKEVAVDPEMLGKVFENLLDSEHRKNKGAFYTPREIVHYMCQESLINYLVSELKIEYKDFEALIRYGDVLADIDSSKRAFETGKFKMPMLIRKNANDIEKALLNVKIADPAVGSGAFPLGMLNEIVRARMNLTQYMADDINAIHRDYANIKGRKPYDLKLQTIQRCIHAVDIERSAVDIAKLRLWLSLIVEENDFKNVKPLPNLDYNIMVGNSLLEEFEGVKLFNEKLLEERSNNKVREVSTEQIGFFNGKKESEYLLDDIYDLQEKFFSANGREEKIKLKDEIDNREWLLIEKTVRENGKIDLLPKIRELKRTNTKPYFLWKLNFPKVFRIKGGFDIVIGNPPYVEIPEKEDKSVYKKNFKEVLSGHYDLYILFFKRAFDIVRDNGIVSYITPHTYLQYLQFENLRKFIYDNSNILEISTRISNIFESAVVDNAIILLRKGNDCLDTKFVLKYTESDEFRPEKFVKLGKKDFDSRTFDVNIINNRKILKPLLKDTVQLGEITDSSQGVTVYSKVQGEKINRFREEVTDSSCKSVLRGRDIFRYSFNWNSQYIQYGDWLWRKRNNKYFEQEKLFIRQTADTLIGVYIREPMYCIDSVHSIIKKTSDFDLKYLLAILNSKLGNYIYKLLISETGKVFAQVKLTYVREIPIKIISKAEQYKFVELVENIITMKMKSNLNCDEDKISSYEKRIDELVYDIYNISEEDKIRIENYI